MLRRLLCYSSVITFGLFGTIVAVKAGHPPYQDRFFSLDSRPLNGTQGGGTQGGAAYSDHFGSGLASAIGAAVPGGGCSGNGNCPVAQTAFLRLWVPDAANVIINGQTTRPQTLGGVHKYSRVFSLEALERNSVSFCEIVVETCDVHGSSQRMRHVIPVQAGERYEVRYPNGFEELPLAYDIESIDLHKTIDEVESSTLSNPTNQPTLAPEVVDAKKEETKQLQPEQSGNSQNLPPKATSETTSPNAVPAPK
jgi:hypothetical protein